MAPARSRFPAIREERRFRTRRRISPAHGAGKGCSPDFHGPCWANDVQSRFRSPGGPPVGHFRRGDSCRGGRHPCSRAERRPDLTAGEYGRSSRFNPVPGPRQEANRSAALRSEQAGCARRARKGHAARCSRAGKRCGAAQGTDAIRTAGGAANGGIDAARDVAPARGSEHAIRRGRATSPSRDGDRSVGGAGYASRPRSAPNGARALDRSVGGAGYGANSRIALDDASARGTGQGDRHRLAGEVERGAVIRAVAGGAPAAWCRPRGRGGTSRDHESGATALARALATTVTWTRC